MQNLASYSFLLASLLAAVAALSDCRTGRIPNWLTLPPLVLAPIAYGVFVGPTEALRSLGSILICGVVPYVLFRQGAMGGGDVKLFAALGALTGFDLFAGFEIEFAAFVVAMLFALAALAWRGRLFRTLATALFVIINPLLPARRKRELTPELMTPVRMGFPVLAATIFVAFPHLFSLWSGL